MQQTEDISVEIAPSDRMERYCKTHPASPSAVRRPQLQVYGDMCIALLGASIDEGIAGFGDNVEMALRAFDDHYRQMVRRPLGVGA